MAQVFITADSLKPSDNTIEQAYSYGPGPTYSPVLIDSAGDGQQASLVPAGNTRATFTHRGFLYKLLNRQQTFGTVILKSTDSGATWAVLDSANSPAFETCSGFYDALTSTVYCAYVAANGAGGALRLINFSLVTETWGAVYGASGAPVASQSAAIAIWKRPNGSLLVMYKSRTALPGSGVSGLGGASYDLTAGTWAATFDVGANILALPGWDASQTLVVQQDSTSVMDAGGVVHVFFNTSSNQSVPVFWGNRCFYQQVLANNSLGSFNDFPGQVQPLPPFPYNTQQLTAFSGSPMGVPVIVRNTIVLPVLMRNDSLADRFPTQLANVYLGTPVAAPVWSLDATKTIDPGAIIDDFIWPQEAPAATFDGTTIYCVFPAQDEDGQNFARMRLCQTTNLDSPADGWTAATAFDLQVNAPSGFQFPTQELVGLAIFAPRPASTGIRLSLYGVKRFSPRDCGGETKPARALQRGFPAASYRPQFIFPTPDGFIDQDSEQFFDSSSTPALGVSLGDPPTILNIPLTIDPDAPFHWRAVKFSASAPNIGVRFRTPKGNYLSDDFVPIWLAFVGPSDGPLSGGQPCIQGVGEPEIVCPANSVVSLDICSYDLVPWSSV